MPIVLLIQKIGSRFLSGFLIAQLSATTAWALSESLTGGEIIITKTANSKGHIISFDRLVRSEAQKDYWYLKTVSVRNPSGQVIATSDFATWNEEKGLLYLENPDRVIALNDTAPPPAVTDSNAKKKQDGAQK